MPQELLDEEPQPPIQPSVPSKKKAPALRGQGGAMFGAIVEVMDTVNQK